MDRHPADITILVSTKICFTSIWGGIISSWPASTSGAVPFWRLFSWHLCLIRQFTLCRDFKESGKRRNKAGSWICTLDVTLTGQPGYPTEIAPLWVNSLQIGASIHIWTVPQQLSTFWLFARTASPAMRWKIGKLMGISAFVLWFLWWRTAGRNKVDRNLMRCLNCLILRDIKAMNDWMWQMSAWDMWYSKQLIMSCNGRQVWTDIRWKLSYVCKFCWWETEKRWHGHSHKHFSYLSLADRSWKERMLREIFIRIWKTRNDHNNQDRVKIRRGPQQDLV